MKTIIISPSHAIDRAVSIFRTEVVGRFEVCPWCGAKSREMKTRGVPIWIGHPHEPTCETQRILKELASATEALRRMYT